MPKLEPLYRCWNEELRDSLYTRRWTEIVEYTGDYWLEGIQCLVWDSETQDAVPLHRFRLSDRDHFFTTTPSEIESLIAEGIRFHYEGIECYVYPRESCPKNTIPLYRHYSSELCDHFYTTSREELKSHSGSYKLERIECHIIPACFERGRLAIPDSLSNSLREACSSLLALDSQRAVELEVVTRESVERRTDDHSLPELADSKPRKVQDQETPKKNSGTTELHSDKPTPYTELNYLTMTTPDSRKVLAPTIVLKKARRKWSEFVGQDVEYTWEFKKMPHFQMALLVDFFSLPRSDNKFYFVLDFKNSTHTDWLASLAIAESLIIVNPDNPNVFVNPGVAIDGPSLTEFLRRRLEEWQ